MESPFRFEFKYPISYTKARVLEQAIKRAGLQQDAHSTYADGSYDVTSLYYDSYDLFDYTEKTGGYKERKKIRLRIYEPYLNHSKYGFLEIKHKYGMMNRKSKIRLTREELEAFLKDGKRTLFSRKWEPHELAVKETILSHMIQRSVKPSAYVTYKRSAYMTPDKSVRITFDSEIYTKKGNTLSEQQFLIPVAPGMVIMEVKYQDLLPHWMRRVILAHDLERSPYSKYEMSLNSIHHYHPIPR